MFYVCPSCNTELTPSENTEETVDLTCPECGCVIDVENDETLHYSQEDVPRLKQFELLEPVGRGAYGLVWRARDTQLDRIVAIKIPTRGDMDPREAKRFLREAQSAAQLRHPNIVSVHDTGIEEGRPYIVSDFIEGVTLSSFLTARSLPIREAAGLCLTISRALHYAHESGIIHRDLKPSNILIDGGTQPFVTDFGLAKRVSADATIAAHVSVLGTPSYMAPEQARGESHYVDRRCDVYSLGVILFLLLTKEKPFRGNTQMVLHQVIHDEPPSPRKLNGKVPRDLETICLKCLEKTPKRRYESAGALADDLERYLEGKPISARPVSLPERAWRWCQRRPAVASLLISLFLSLSIGLIGVTHFWLEAAENATQLGASLYRAQMNLVAITYDAGDIAGVRQTLNRFSEDPSWAGVRGFEWRYFDALTSPFQQVASQGNVVVDIAVSHDGALCAACSRNRQVRVWDARSGELIRTLSLAAGRFNSVDFCPNSTLLASGSSDGMLRVWDPVNSEVSLREIKHGPAVTTVRYSGDGRLLLSSGNNGAIRIWNADDLEVVEQIPSGMSRTMHAMFLPDGERIVVATEDGRIRVWDVGTRRQLRIVDPLPELIQTMACSDDGRTIVIGTYSGVLHVVPLEADLEPWKYDSTWGRIDDIEFTHRANVIALAASDGALHLFDLNRRRVVRELMTHPQVGGVLDRSADGRFLSIGGGNGAIQRARLDAFDAPAILWHESDVRDLDFLPQGDHVVAVDSDGVLRVWDVTTGESEQLSADDETKALTVSAHPGGRLIASGGLGPHVTIWDRDSLDVVEQLSITEFSDVGVLKVEFSTTGLNLAVATRQGPVLVYQMNDPPELLFAVPVSDSQVSALDFSTNDRLLALAYSDSRIELYDGLTGALIEGTLDTSDSPAAIVFCQDNRALAVGTESGQVQIWDLETRSMRTNVKGHASRISCLEVLPDGVTLVSGGGDWQLRLWDAPSGELVTRLTGHNRQVFAISISPNGDTIASGGLEGDIRIWRAGPTP